MFSWSSCPVGFKTKILYFIFGQFWNCTWCFYKMAFSTKREVERNLDLFLTGSFNSTLFISMWFISSVKKGKGAEPVSFNSFAMLKLLNCFHVSRIKLKFLFHFKPALIYLQRTGFPYICMNMTCLLSTSLVANQQPGFNHRKCIDFIFYSKIIKASNVPFIYGLHSAVSASVKISSEVFLLVYIFKKKNVL